MTSVFAPPWHQARHHPLRASDNLAWYILAALLSLIAMNPGGHTHTIWNLQGSVTNSWHASCAAVGEQSGHWHPCVHTNLWHVLCNYSVSNFERVHRTRAVVTLPSIQPAGTLHVLPVMKCPHAAPSPIAPPPLHVPALERSLCLMHPHSSLQAIINITSTPNNDSRGAAIVL